MPQQMSETLGLRALLAKLSAGTTDDGLCQAGFLRMEASLARDMTALSLR